MKRFVTYLYEYENGHKMKNAGFLRVDIRNQMVNMQVSIRHPELGNAVGNLYIIVEDKMAYSICLGEIQMKEGQYQGLINCRYQAIGDSPYSLLDAVGVGIRFEGGCYLASSWKDEADEMIARGAFVEYGINISPSERSNEEDIMEEHDFSTEAKTQMQMEKKMEMAADAPVENVVDDCEELIEAAELAEPDPTEHPDHDLIYEEWNDQDTYRKINLNEIATLPSCNWYFSNNSFLIHGFWNYGYLVLKETMEAGKKKAALGVPGIFEQPEMVMAAYFGFTTFEALPSQVVEMAIGETYHTAEKEKNQEPKVGTFGCWFANL